MGRKGRKGRLGRLVQSDLKQLKRRPVGRMDQSHQLVQGLLKLILEYLEDLEDQ